LTFNSRCENSTNCKMVTDTETVRGSEDDMDLSRNANGKAPTPLAGNKVELTLAMRIVITARY
jgi:hypothetical protein